jgi:hypothetical protein
MTPKFPRVIFETDVYTGPIDFVAAGNGELKVSYFTLYRFLKRSTRPRESTILCSPV